MNFDEVIKALKEFEGSEEYNNFISGLINDERVNAYLDTDNGKKLMRPRLDRHFNNSLETWKTNNLQGLIDAKVKELYPDADPKDIEIQKLQQELAEQKASALKQTLTNKALTVANEKGLPADLVSYFIGDDEDSTMENLSNFEKIYTGAISAKVDEKLKGASHVPPIDNNEPIDGVTAAFQALNPGLKISE